MTFRRSLLALLLVSTISCIVPNPAFVRGTDGDSDIDGDSDTDVDGDTDVDSDTDVDGDGDSDTDIDGDSDIDGDTDTDIDGDSDIDGDTDTDVDGDADRDVDEVGPPPRYLGRIHDRVFCEETTLVVPLEVDVAAGHTLIVVLGFRGVDATFVSVEDDSGNVYTLDADALQPLGPSARVVIHSAWLTTALTAGQSITVQTPSTTSGAIVVEELEGLAQAPVDDAQGEVGESATPRVEVTTTAADTLLFTATANAVVTTYTESPGWNRLLTVDMVCGGPSRNGSLNGSYRLVDAAGLHSHEATLGTSLYWATALVAYRVY